MKCKWIYYFESCYIIILIQIPMFLALFDFKLNNKVWNKYILNFFFFFNIIINIDIK